MHIIVVFEEVKDDPKVSKCLMIQEAVCVNPCSFYYSEICMPDCFHIRFPYSWSFVWADI